MPDEIVPFLPEEAYHLTERARLMSDAATEGMDEYGLGGLAYAKARDFATKANQARAWQDQNMPEIIPEDSTPIPDVDREIETRPETTDGNIMPTRSLNLRDLRDANLTRQNEWDPSDKITPSYRGNELAGEVGEACNVIKKLERERLGIRGSRSSPHALAEELADVVICVDLICAAYGINLDLAVIRKFNDTSEKYGLTTRLK